MTETIDFLTSSDGDALLEINGTLLIELNGVDPSLIDMNDIIFV